MWYQALHRQDQHRPPALPGCVNVHAAAQSASQIALLSRPDRKINPRSIGRHLDFLVASDFRRIRLEKHLAHVAIPQLIPAAISIRIWKYGYAPIRRIKPQIKVLWSPQQSHLRFSLRISVQALPIRAEPHRRRDLPRRVRRKPFCIRRADEARSGSNICSRRLPLVVPRCCHESRFPPDARA